MTLTIDLTPEQEERLHREAQRRGVNADALFREMLDRTLAQIGDMRPKKQRVLGLHAGQWWVADGFDDPLPDASWLGEE